MDADATDADVTRIGGGRGGGADSKGAGSDEWNASEARKNHPPLPFCLGERGDGSGRWCVVVMGRCGGEG